MAYDEKFMKEAYNEAKKGISKGHGGPFGAVIVKEGRIVSKGHNMVLKQNDATCHAEVQAIRKASKVLKRAHLDDCVIYSTCEPCPMCLGAIYWARIGTVYYVHTRKDAEKVGFFDAHVYKAIEMVNKNKAPLDLVFEKAEFDSDLFDVYHGELY